MYVRISVGVDYTTGDSRRQVRGKTLLCVFVFEGRPHADCLLSATPVRVFYVLPRKKLSRNLHSLPFSHLLLLEQSTGQANTSLDPSAITT